jgi:hypothetical protein
VVASFTDVPATRAVVPSQSVQPAQIQQQQQRQEQPIQPMSILAQLMSPNPKKPPHSVPAAALIASPAPVVIVPVTTTAAPTSTAPVETPLMQLFAQAKRARTSARKAPRDVGDTAGKLPGDGAVISKKLDFAHNSSPLRPTNR